MDDAMVWGPKFWWGALPYLDGVMVSGSQSLVGLVWLSHLDDVMDLGHQPLMTCVIPSWRWKGFGVLVFGATGCPIFGELSLPWSWMSLGVSATGFWTQ